MGRGGRPFPGDSSVRRSDASRRAAASGGGLVSVEPLTLADGRIGLEVVTKWRQGLGFGFRGVLVVERPDRVYRLELSIAESFTGAREAVVQSQMLTVGEIRFDDEHLGPRDPKTGGRKIKGMTADPYDAAFDDEAVYGTSDDARLDELIPASPLSVIRETLNRVTSSWESSGSVAASHTGAPASDGPRRMLSDEVLKQIYWASGRNDLLERHLLAELAAAGDHGESGPGVGRLLLMLGLAQHNSDQLMKARDTFERAVQVFSAPGDRPRETGLALSLLGRTLMRRRRALEAKSTVKRAIALLEEYDDVDMALGNALAILGTILLDEGRVEEATPTLQRADALMERRPATPGPATLQDLTGGPPPAVYSRISTVPSRD